MHSIDNLAGKNETWKKNHIIVLFWFPVLLFIIAFASKGKRQWFKQSTYMAHIEFSLISGISSVKQKEEGEKFQCSRSDLWWWQLHICITEMWQFQCYLRPNLDETYFSFSHARICILVLCLSFFLSTIFRVGFLCIMLLNCFFLSFFLSLSAWNYGPIWNGPGGKLGDERYIFFAISFPLAFEDVR